MRINCPYCGSRDLREFTFLGEACEADAARDAAAPGKSGGALSATGPQAAAYDAVYLRDNPLGRSRGWWFHDHGCRSWLLIERDNRTHDILSVSLARPEAGQ